MSFQRSFTPSLSLTSADVAKEHARKNICQVCGEASSDLRDGICWRHRPVDPRDAAPPVLPSEGHA